MSNYPGNRYGKGKSQSQRRQSQSQSQSESESELEIDDCFWVIFVVMIFISILLSGCAAPPLAISHAPGMGVLAVSADKTGFLVSPDKRAYLILQGIPAAWFIPSGPAWYMSAEHEIEAADILLAIRNPGIVK